MMIILDVNVILITWQIKLVHAMLAKMVPSHVYVLLAIREMIVLLK